MPILNSVQRQRYCLYSILFLFLLFSITKQKKTFKVLRLITKAYYVFPYEDNYINFVIPVTNIYSMYEYVLCIMFFAMNHVCIQIFALSKLSKTIKFSSNNYLHRFTRTFHP